LGANSLPAFALGGGGAVSELCKMTEIKGFAARREQRARMIPYQNTTVA